MTGLSPGVRLPKDMDAREFATWCKAQGIESVASDAVAAHVAEADPHPQYALDTDMTAAIAAAVAALNLDSGTYTPALTNVANLAGNTPLQCQFLRVGSVVTVSGEVGLNVSGAGNTQLGISLPVASNFSALFHCGGVASSVTESATIQADSTNDRAEMRYTAVSVGLQTFWFSFTYLVI